MANARAHLDFSDGTSAWVDLTDLLPPLPRWRYDVVGVEGYLFDREQAFPPIKLSEPRNKDVSLVPEIAAAMNRLYPRPEGRRYER